MHGFLENIQLAAFLQKLSSDFRQAAIKHHPVPFGTLLLLTVLIFPGLAGSQPKRSDHAASGQIPDIRINTQISDQDDFVNTTICHVI